MNIMNEAALRSEPPVISTVSGSVPPALSAPTKAAPKRTRLWLIIPCSLMGIVFLLVALRIAAVAILNMKPEVRTLRSLCRLNLSADASRAQVLCTDRGLFFAERLCDAQGVFGPAKFNVTGLKANPGQTDIQMIRDTADGKTIIFVRMVYQNGWKFDDLKIQQVNGESVNLWCSSIAEHPVAAQLGQVDWEKLFRTGNEFLDFALKLKQLSGDGDRSQGDPGSR